MTLFLAEQMLQLALLQTARTLVAVLDDIVTVLDEDQNNTGIGVM